MKIVNARIGIEYIRGRKHHSTEGPVARKATEPAPGSIDKLSAVRGRPSAGIVAAVFVAVVLPVTAAGGGLLTLWLSPEALEGGRQAMTREARFNVEVLAEAVEGYCRTHGRMPGPAGPVPVAPAPAPVRAPFGEDPGFATLGWKRRLGYRVVATIFRSSCVRWMCSFWDR